MLSRRATILRSRLRACDASENPLFSLTFRPIVLFVRTYDGAIFPSIGYHSSAPDVNDDSVKSLSTLVSLPSRSSFNSSAGSFSGPTAFPLDMNRMVSADLSIVGTTSSDVFVRTSGLELINDCRVEVGRLGPEEGVKSLYQTRADECSVPGQFTLLSWIYCCCEPHGFLPLKSVFFRCL